MEVEPVIVSVFLILSSMYTLFCTIGNTVLGNEVNRLQNQVQAQQVQLQTKCLKED